jgi:hypothetical protein
MEVTIEFKGVEFEVEYDYQPEEPAEIGPDAQYPGCGESVESINTITHAGVCFLEIMEVYDDEIKDAVLEKLHEGYRY